MSPTSTPTTPTQRAVIARLVARSAQQDANLGQSAETGLARVLARPTLARLPQAERDALQGAYLRAYTLQRASLRLAVDR